MKPRLLKIDVETRPHKGYFWKMFDENISLDQLEEPSQIICFAAQWHGEKKVTFGAAWNGGRRKMLTKLRAMLEEADAVISFNGDHFDLPAGRIDRSQHRRVRQTCATAGGIHQRVGELFLIVRAVNRCRAFQQQREHVVGQRSDSLGRDRADHRLPGIVLRLQAAALGRGR